MTACTGTPISWLRLETFALGAPDAQVAEHVAVCEACRACLDGIRTETVALPPLVIPVRPRRRVWLRFAMPLAGLAVAVLLVFVLHPIRPEREVSIKGVGEVTIGVVRERAGVITPDATTFAPGDRWKVVITCPPEAGAWVDVAVIEDRARTADYPLPVAHVACGNRVVIPGAFVLTGERPNRVCARIAADAAPPRGIDLREMACATIKPE